MVRTRKLKVALMIAAGCAGLMGCADRHQIQWLPSPDGAFVLAIDYVHKAIGTEDVIVSLEEKRGIATEVAVFRNIERFNASWLGPEDLNICQVGRVQDYKTKVVINAHDGNHDFHFHYDCTSS